MTGLTGEGPAPSERRRQSAGAVDPGRPKTLVRRLTPFVFLAALTPIIYLIARAATGGLGVNPIETITLETGRWTLRLLLVTLAITPVRRLFKWNEVIRWRRMLGLFAFFYACLHLTTYVVLDQFFAWSIIIDDVTKRKFIMAGMGAFVLLLPLAVTSTRGWIRRLGRNWVRLHWMIYPAAVLGVVHFVWKVKSDYSSPTRYAIVLAVLLLVRLSPPFRRR